ncbi:MAG: M15 family metallopeptidase [Longimicrobiales bacterium]
MRIILLCALALSACTLNLERIQTPPASVAVTTGGPWASMIYLARTDSGVIAVDLGSDGDGHALDRALARLGAERGDLTTVFVTHSHRDHVAAWRHARHARFVLAAPELASFTGAAEHAGAVPRLAEQVAPFDHPAADELWLHAFARDTVFHFGADTVFAYALPGHTAGSAAYLLRGVLFAGDALGWTPLLGFHGAKRIYSDDAARSDSSVAALVQRLPAGRVQWVCTAHGKCARPAEALAAWSCPDSAALPELVRPRSLDTTIVEEIRYATADNFMGARLPGYERPLALLRPAAAQALLRVQAQLRTDGLGLKIWDAYRPVRATLAMVDWAERTGNAWLLDEGYVARRSGHNLGATVDLTLYELSTGRELDMGTAYDEFTEAAHTANASGDVARNRQRLVRAMREQGWVNYEKEWWHYTLPGEHEPLDIGYGCLAHLQELECE